MTVYNLRASNNATFRWTRDLSAIAEVYNLATATIRMQARKTATTADPPALEWVTGGSSSVVSVDPVTNFAVFAASEAVISALSGSMVYDCRLELPGGESLVLFGGRLVLAAGVTRKSTDATTQTGLTGIGDTVTVDGETSSSPVPLPLSLAAALAAVSPANLVAALLALPPAQLASLAQAILAALPAYSGTGAAPVPTGQVFVDSSSFLVRAQ